MKMKPFNFFRFFLLAGLIAAVGAGCDIIDAPYVVVNTNNIPADSLCLIEAQANDPFGAGTPAIEKKVLLEEYTGHKCGNCPPASAVAHRLKTVDYPDRVIVVSVHSGPLAQPAPGASKFATNFTTQEGNTLYEEINKAYYDAVPAGFFDRKLRSLGSGTWPTKVAEQLALAPEVGIRMYACFNADARTFSVVMDAKYLVAGKDNDYFSVYLVEDSIVDWQKDYNPSLPSEDIQNYTHHDVLRKSLNGVWGEKLTVDGPTAINSRFTRILTGSIPANYNEKKCSLVAFIYDQATRQVRQVEEILLIP